MPAFTLSCVDIMYRAFVEENAEGQLVPTPGSETFSVTSSDATAIAAAIGVMPPTAPHPGVAAVVMTPMRQPRTGDVPIVVTVTSSGGEAALVYDVTLGPDDVPTQLADDPTTVFLQTQPLPPA